jgi:membrane fusion protein, copper/silver efflux system
VALVGAGGYWFGARHTTSSQPSAAPTASSSNQKIDPKTGRKVLYWHDPMTPGPRFDKPGKSPFMDMELVPVYADQTTEQSHVSISPRTVQNLGIRTATVTEGAMDAGIETVGAIAVDERTIVAVQSRVSGYIEKLYVRAQFDAVAHGQPLVDIYAPEWLSAQEEYLALKRATQPGAELLAQAARERLGLLGIPEDQIGRIEQSGQSNPRITLYAPQGGVVWELGTREGSAVSPGMTLFKLARLSSVWVNAEVPEAQTPLVLPGARVIAHAGAFPEQRFNGRVALILPDVNPVTRTIKARIELDNPKGILKPGMFARIEFHGPGRRMRMVPSEAVIHTGTRVVVILAEGDGRFRPIEVETGRESGDMTEIVRGVEIGQKIVASGQFLIDSEAGLTGVLARMNEPGTAHQGEHK